MKIHRKSIMYKIFSHRWIIGIIVWILLVIFQIHGSSIGFYAHILQAPDLDTALIGTNHSFQLDEWAVFTPLAFSQYFDGFSYFSHVSRAAVTDVALVYGQPCWDMITVFRPFLWGYLFLPAGNGLSFFWTGRLIFLFLISYEFGMLFFQQDKKISLSYALLTAFSPMVQWWFSINGFVETLLWGQLGVLAVNGYIHTSLYKKRILYMLGLAYVMVAYAVSFYPAWQVSFAYVFLLMAGWIIYKNRKNTYRTYKDIFLGIILICLTALPIVHVLFKSWDTILAFANSIYPGQRRDLGGGFSFDWLFHYILLYMAPFGWDMGYAPTGAATFISFAPMGIMLAGWNYCKTHFRDSLTGTLIILLVVYITHFLYPWPDFLARVTLLAFSPAARMIPAIDFLQVLILLRVLSFRPIACSKKTTACMTVLFTGFELWMVLPVIKPEHAALWIIVVSMFSVCAALYILRLRHGLVLFIVLTAFVSGMAVNPVARGVQSVYGTHLAREITEIAAQDKGYWIVDNGDTWNTEHINYMNSYPIMFGAPTINSVNLYVYWPRWEPFGLTEKERSILNRYAHMNITLDNTKPTKFQNPKGNSIIADIVNIRLNIGDLKKLNVSYVLSNRDLSVMHNDTVVLVPLDAANGYTVYHVEYK